MSISGLLRAAISTFGLAVFTALAAEAAPSGNSPAEPTVATQTPAASPPALDEAQNCRYTALPGSRIKVHVCTALAGVEYRMARRARTIAVAIPSTGSVPIAAPLPQVQ